MGQRCLVFKHDVQPTRLVTIAVHRLNWEDPLQRMPARDELQQHRIGQLLHWWPSYAGNHAITLDFQPRRSVPSDEVQHRDPRHSSAAALVLLLHCAVLWSAVWPPRAVLPLLAMETKQ